MKIPFDNHVHTNISPDAVSSPEDMIKKAVELEIEHISITDHVECNIFNDNTYFLKNYGTEFLQSQAVERSFNEIPKLKEKYKDKIKILYGVELGEPTQDLAVSSMITRKYPYDFIIGSVHSIRGLGDFYFLNYNENKPESLLERYFEEIFEMAEWNNFDTLAHLTYPLRYIIGEYKINIDISKYNSITDKIFKTLIKNQKALEINTSGLRQKIAETLPGIKYLTRYYELGGRLITIGSDAHKTDDLGKGITEGIKIAKEIGFTEACYFENRKINFYKL